MGNREIEDSLERLDKLTQEEARMASAEQLKMTHNVDGKVMGVDNRVRGVEGQVEGVRGDVQDARVDVQDVGNMVQDFGDRVQGFRPQIHPSIITSHAKPITTAQLNGFSKEVYSIGGNLLVPSCGYMENVCHS
jgi:hypothetical protein